MDPLLAELAALVDGAERQGAHPVVIGAFALRTYLRRPDRRTTVDVDILVERATNEPCPRR